MAGGAERILRRRIKSVQSTKKITKAMELIAASRILKAQQRVNAARPYSEQITEVIRNLAAGGAGMSHPLLQPREEVRTVAYIVVTSDRGLCGGYNTGVIRAVERAMRHAGSAIVIGPAVPGASCPGTRPPRWRCRRPGLPRPAAGRSGRGGAERDRTRNGARSS